MIAIIVVVVLVILGGGGTAGYLLTRPKPTITISSDYKVGATPAGAAQTVLHVAGEKFSGSSSITFLLDGQPAPGAQTFQSDNSGVVNATLTVTADWAVGTHTITAKDASGYVTQTGVQVQIVHPGEANTPGPNGSPSNSVSFSVAVVIDSKDFGTINETLIITGKSDSGGTVCQARDDGSTQFSYSSTLNFTDGTSLPYTETTTNSCSGTYAAGHLTYNETTVTDVWDFGGGTQCQGDSHKMQILTGDFSDAKTISGTYSEDKISLNCTYKGQPITVSADTGTFTATVNQ